MPIDNRLGMPILRGMDEKKHPDAELIEALGGTSAVAGLCGIRPPSVSEWKRRGIPKAQRNFLRLAKTEVFVRHELQQAEKAI